MTYVVRVYLDTGQSIDSGQMSYETALDKVAELTKQIKSRAGGFVDVNVGFMVRSERVIAVAVR